MTTRVLGRLPSVASSGLPRMLARARTVGGLEGADARATRDVWRGAWTAARAPRSLPSLALPWTGESALGRGSVAET
ncbi:hypothetical protein [Archangium sp.]|uniref:hypothetical protein n=1 Tax=Archangium sp. TaxID=1872627 RepID=UPI00286AC6D3|nr:hypothetical protein [Archangium sp.]